MLLLTRLPSLNSTFSWASRLYHYACEKAKLRMKNHEKREAHTLLHRHRINHINYVASTISVRGFHWLAVYCHQFATWHLRRELALEPGPDQRSDVGRPSSSSIEPAHLL
jgi:hypothetical protein